MGKRATNEKKYRLVMPTLPPDGRRFQFFKRGCRKLPNDHYHIAITLKNDKCSNLKRAVVSARISENDRLISGQPYTKVHMIGIRCVTLGTFKKINRIPGTMPGSVFESTSAVRRMHQLL